MPEINSWLKKAVKIKASDLHLSSGSPPFLRLHGKIRHVKGESELTPEKTMELLNEIIPEENAKEFLEIYDTDFAYEVDGIGRFRVNIFQDRNGPCAVFRMIPTKIISAEELELPQCILDFCLLTKGLVLVTGPTGSGKSTTLCAMIDYINRTRSEHIITIEDPIEFVHRNKKCLINQRELRSHTKSFKNALRAALREDPDIVLVGEMRDLDTIEIAIETAETGHLVFGTLHTNAAATTVERMIEQFPGAKQNLIRQMLAESLKGVIAQMLVPTRDGTGRVPAIEVLVNTSAVANLIRQEKTHQIQTAMQAGTKQGMVTFNKSLLELVKNRTVSPEDAYLKALDKDDLAQDMAKEGFQIDRDVQRGLVSHDASNE